MTAEEMADLRMGLESFWAAEGDDYEPMRDDVVATVERIVREARRAAEREAADVALERAARAVVNSTSCYIHTLARAADRVRSLKSGGGSSGEGGGE